MSVNDGIVLHRGWLSVRGLFRKWHWRFGVVSMGLLNLYKSEDLDASNSYGKPEETIDIHGCIVHARETKTQGFAFKIVEPHKKHIARGATGIAVDNLILRVTTAEDRELWVRALETATGHADVSLSLPNSPIQHPVLNSPTSVNLRSNSSEDSGGDAPEPKKSPRNARTNGRLMKSLHESFDTLKKQGAAGSMVARNVVAQAVSGHRTPGARSPRIAATVPTEATELETPRKGAARRAKTKTAEEVVLPGPSPKGKEEYDGKPFTQPPTPPRKIAARATTGKEHPSASAMAGAGAGAGKSNPFARTSSGAHREGHVTFEQEVDEHEISHGSFASSHHGPGVTTLSRQASAVEVAAFRGTHYEAAPRESRDPCVDTECTESIDDTGWAVVKGLLKQVSFNMDLSKVVLPTFILEPRSFLDKLSDWLSHVDILSDLKLQDDPLDRMKTVLKWYVSGFYIRPRGVKKPYNPILGEIFRCKFMHPDGSTTFFIAEQVSHHPPISAFYAQNRHLGFIIQGAIRFKSAFRGTYVKACLDGGAYLHDLNHDQRYTFSFPSQTGSGFLYGTMRSELVDTVTVACEATSMKAEIEFLATPRLRSDYNRMRGSITHHDQTLYTIDGYWSGTSTLVSVGGRKEELWEAKGAYAKRVPVYWPIMKEQKEFESQRLWVKVTQAIAAKDQGKATAEKTRIEQAQRDERAERDAAGKTWTPRLFAPTPDETCGYRYNFMNPTLFDPTKEYGEYEQEGALLSIAYDMPASRAATQPHISTVPTRGAPPKKALTSPGLLAAAMAAGMGGGVRLPEEESARDAAPPPEVGTSIMAASMGLAGLGGGRFGPGGGAAATSNADGGGGRSGAPSRDYTPSVIDGLPVNGSDGDALRDLPGYESSSEAHESSAAAPPPPVRIVDDVTGEVLQDPHHGRKNSVRTRRAALRPLPSAAPDVGFNISPIDSADRSLFGTPSQAASQSSALTSPPDQVARQLDSLTRRLAQTERALAAYKDRRGGGGEPRLRLVAAHHARDTLGGAAPDDSVSNSSASERIAPSESDSGAPVSLKGHATPTVVPNEPRALAAALGNQLFSSAAHGLARLSVAQQGLLFVAVLVVLWLIKLLLVGPRMPHIPAVAAAAAGGGAPAICLPPGAMGAHGFGAQGTVHV